MFGDEKTLEVRRRSFDIYASMSIAVVLFSAGTMAWFRELVVFLVLDNKGKCSRQQRNF